MTAGTPMTGRDTKAQLTGFFVGLAFVLAVVLITMTLTNKKFEGHAAEGAAATSSQH
ncbi:MAG TPA: hypothetical protein PK788_05210 [Gemmatimonadaceae bacterium]|nr:hypothetical protein [Gemmatimonadaceae bacterium]HRQ77253.1 hypothetical protein [Gemmatimonadaceae bacterium]